MLRFSLLSRLEIPSQNNKNLSSSSKNPHLRRVNCGFSPRVSTKFPPQNNKKVFVVGVSLLFDAQMLTYTKYAALFFTLPTFLKLTNTVDLFFLFRTKRTKKARPFVFSGVVCLCSLKSPRTRDRIGRHFLALAKTPALRPEKSDGQDWMQDITNLSGSSTCRSATPKNLTDKFSQKHPQPPAAIKSIVCDRKKADEIYLPLYII